MTLLPFRRQSGNLASKEYTLSQIPQVKISNYAFRNNGDLTFVNATTDWGLNNAIFFQWRGMGRSG